MSKIRNKILRKENMIPSCIIVDDITYRDTSLAFLLMQVFNNKSANKIK